MRYDIAIIGTGPAGLEAALTAAARNKTFVLFGKKDLSDKVSKAHGINNYLGLPKISGNDMQSVFLKQIEDAGIKIREEKVNFVYPMDGYFAIQTNDIEKMTEADSVILATGVASVKELPGEDKFLGRALSYCATCDGALYKDKRVIVVGYDKTEEEEVNFLAELAREVVYFPQYEDKVNVSEKVIVKKSKALEYLGDKKAERLKTEDGEFGADGFFVLRKSIAPEKFVFGLECVNGHVKVDLDMKTNIAGCFAAGDITGLPYQYIKAAGQGNVACLSAVTYLYNKNKK